MITIKNDRTAYIPERDRHIGFENDHLIESRVFEICDNNVHGFSFKLDMADTLDIIDLEKQFTNDGKCRLVWNITADAIGKGGIIRVQLRAFDEKGERVWHSEIMEFTAKTSINAEKVADDEKTLSEFEQLETRVTVAVENAETAAKNASAYASEAENALKSFEDAYGTAADNITKAENHYADKNNPHKVIASQVGTYTKEKIDDLLSGKSDSGHTHEDYEKHLSNMSNPHEVTASQVGAYPKDKLYTKEEVDELIENVDVDLSEYARKDEVFETDSFAWTDFPYDVEAAEWDDTYSLSDTQIMGGGAKFTIHCKGKTLGFDYTCDNAYASYIEINGVKYTGDSGSIPLTYMESDVIVYCSLAIFEFSNMTVQSIKGVSELEGQIGDIDTALDAILKIQQEYTQEAEVVLPWEPDVGGDAV